MRTQRAPLRTQGWIIDTLATAADPPSCHWRSDCIDEIAAVVTVVVAVVLMVFSEWGGWFLVLWFLLSGSRLAMVGWKGRAWKDWYWNWSRNCLRGDVCGGGCGGWWWHWHGDIVIVVVSGVLPKGTQWDLKISEYSLSAVDWRIITIYVYGYGYYCPSCYVLSS